MNKWLSLPLAGDFRNQVLPPRTFWDRLDVMKTAGTSARVLMAFALAFMTPSLAACSDSVESSDPSGQARAEALKGQAQNDQQRQQAEAVQELLTNFREGPAVPTGWPSEIVPVPPSSKPVASINKSQLADGAVAMTMLYSSTSAPEKIQSAFESGLKDKGWNNIQTSQQGDQLLVAAQKDDYSGIFMSGTLPSVPKLKSGETINVMAVLARPEA